MEETKTPENKAAIFITDRGTAWAAEIDKDEVGHTTANYSIKEDRVDEQGNRVLVLTPIDEREHKRKKKAIVSQIMEQIGEPRSRTLRSLLNDVISDYYPETIQRLFEKIVEKGVRVRPAEGCFKIVVGDMRTKDGEEIMLRG